MSFPHEKRRYYRLEYPPSERPRLFLGPDAWTITELSEGGACVVNDGRPVPKLDAIVAGWIVFRDSGSEDVTGVVIRRTSVEWVVRFERGVTFSRMMREQQRVLSRPVQPRNY